MSARENILLRIRKVLAALDWSGTGVAIDDRPANGEDRTGLTVCFCATFFVSGPSRTADIEQTIVIGAHGPYRVHVILVDG